MPVSIIDQGKFYCLFNINELINYKHKGEDFMKHLTQIFAIIFVAFLFFSNTNYAQEGNVIYVQTWDFEMPEGGSWAEFDSLSALVTKNVVSKNDKILSQRIVRHFWGSNSRQLIFIREYASIEDVVGNDDAGTKLFEAAWKTEEERKAFSEAYSKYFRGEHSDEIYSEIPGTSK